MPAKIKSPKKKIATHSDYANQHFEPQFSQGEASRIGGEILTEHSISFRIAAVVLSKTKQELIEGFGQERETLLTMIESLQESVNFIKGLAEMNDGAIARLLAVACCVVPEEEDKALKAA